MRAGSFCVFLAWVISLVAVSEASGGEPSSSTHVASYDPMEVVPYEAQSFSELGKALPPPAPHSGSLAVSDMAHFPMYLIGCLSSTNLGA